jgi:TolB protein
MLQANRMKPLLLAAACGLMLSAGAGEAPADDDKTVVIDVNNTTRILYPIAIPVGIGGSNALSKEIAQATEFDLSVSGWFRVLDPRSFLADLEKERLGIEPQKWKDVGAFGVMKYQVSGSGDNVTVEFRLYEVEKGDGPVLSKRYSGSARDIRALAHKWSNDVVKYFTGEDGFFGSKIAFVTKRRRGGKRVLAMDFDGKGVYAVSRNRSINILPTFSPSGGKIAYTSYMRRNPDLYVAPAGGGRPKRLSRYKGMNTGASFSPDGSKIALTLSKDGNPEIYLISASTGRVIKRLTNNRAIDTSPTFSADGREIAFVSDRDGGPQIFVMNANGSNQRRVSFNGSYNTTPDFSPRKGSRVVAYTTRDEGRYDIVTIDLNTSKYTRVTQGQGNNEEPSWAPNGMAIAFASTGRKTGPGVYIANADGTGQQRKVWSGRATSVDWGPNP